MDGINHDVLFKSSAWSGKQTLTVDGNTIPLKQSFAQTFTGAEYPVQIGSKICQLAVVGSKADIAVDGRFIGSGKPYAPIGGELSGTAGETGSAALTNNVILIDGEAVSLTVFKIDGANYFKLRDLGEALDFHVGYDDETKTVFISGARGYEKDA